MPFKPNDKSINRAGRKKGVPNKTTEELRRLLHNFIDANIEKLQADFDQLEPKQRLDFLDKLFSHVLPKPITSLSQLSEEDLNLILEKLKSEQPVYRDPFAKIRENHNIQPNEQTG